MPSLCRDCLIDHQGTPLPWCDSCGSERLIRHAERDDLGIAHMDCDAFYATVEKRDNPDLQDKALIIGGGQRGVVSTCCYNARKFGVRSAMPMFQAMKLCPQAIILPPDMEKYNGVARELRALMRELTPLVEPLSIDEAFLDLIGTGRLHGASPAISLAKMQKRVENEIGITVSVGLSHNKFLAKIASEFQKPRGFSIIGKAETLDLLAPRSVGIIWGVGSVMLQRLHKDGIQTISELRALDEPTLLRRYGSEGPRFFRLARGIDTRAVTPERETKSISAETTFDQNLSDHTELESILWRLSERVAERLRRAQLSGATVTLKLRTAEFQIRTRTRAVAPTQLAIRLFEIACDLLRKEPEKTSYRLIGIGVSDFHPVAEADRGDLLDTRTIREAKVAEAVSTLRDKFGRAAVKRGPGIKT